MRQMSQRPNKIVVCLACSLFGKIIDKMSPSYQRRLKRLQIHLFESIFYDSLQLRKKREAIEEGMEGNNQAISSDPSGSGSFPSLCAVLTSQNCHEKIINDCLAIHE